MAIGDPMVGKHARRLDTTPCNTLVTQKHDTVPLEHTFLHLPGVGLRTERRLWRNGFWTWGDLERKSGHQLSLFGKSRWESWMEAIKASRHALLVGDADFFAARLPSREHYRIAATFPKETVFLDIETTGLSLYYDRITLIGLSQGNRYICHIPDADEERSQKSHTWRAILSAAKCLVTFNGTVFDLKFLLKFYPDLAFPRAHVDLRFLARHMALTGGQKAIEEKLGLVRPDEIGDINGPRAVVLWYEYQTGNRNAGQRLVQYNHADVEGMKAILDEVTGLMAEHNGYTPVSRRTDFAKSSSVIRFRRAVSSGHYIHVPRIRKDRGPNVRCDELLASIPDKNFRVVGIDLAGSERGTTGWCYMEGSRAETMLVRSDVTILDEIRSAKPQVVSIDSPLSLPQGRIHVGDDDPGRARYGIMRQCERTLKRRGINVYPTLIPSMQGLTARGIRIAEQIRSLGIPVIESYPGAAQDIMNIPRKRASLNHLKEGLGRFGVTGSFRSGKPTHDEVDAVTSAVVGLFFWSGRFEALGNEAEDYLIIPNLRGDAIHSVDGCPRRVVGISGPICAGKTTAGRQLERQGFVYGRYSEVLVEFFEEQDGRASRASLQEVGHRIHVESGQRYLNQRLLNRLHIHEGDYVIDGLRWPEDHAFWAERFGPAYCHVHLQAATEVRRRRYAASRGSPTEFDRVVEHEVESGVTSLNHLANFVVVNERTPETLDEKVRGVTADYFEELSQCRLQS